MNDLIAAKNALMDLPLTQFSDKTEEKITTAIVRLSILLRQKERDLKAINEAELL